MLAGAFWTLVVAFPASEIALAIFKRARSEGATVADRGSMRLLWIVIALSIFGGAIAQSARGSRMHLPDATVYAVALMLMVGGLTLRWVAILTLGRLFTVNVAIHAGHTVVETGVYRHLRHPSYTGLLLAFLGIGIGFRNWVSLLVVMVPIALAVFNRIRKEEAALLAALGEPYANYCRRTKRLLPGIL